MNQKQLTLGEAARHLGVKPYKITYAIVTGLVPEPTTRIGGNRVFESKDLERLSRYFLEKEEVR